MKLKNITLKKKWFQILKVIYVYLCLTGLSWQVIKISINYFKFEVVSVIKIKLPGEESAKAMNLCFDLYQSVNKSKLLLWLEERSKDLEYEVQDLKRRKAQFDGELNTKTNMTRKQKAVARNQSNFEFRFNKSDISAAITNIIKKMQLKGNENKYKISQGIQDTQHKLLTVDDFFGMTNTIKVGCEDADCNVTRFILNNEICYRIILKPLQTRKKKTDYFGQKIRSLITVDAQHTNISITRHRVVLNDVSSLPWNEMIQADKYYFDTTKSTISDLGYSEYLDTSALTYNISRLSAPYVENCYDYRSHGYFDWNDAIATCVNQLMIEEEGTVSGLKHIIENGNFGRHKVSQYNVDGTYFSQITFRNQADNIKKCFDNKFMPDCIIIQTATIFRKSPRTVPPEVNFELDRFGFEIIAEIHQHISQSFSDDPSYVIQSSPKFEVIDFISFLLGCLGTWLGFSFLGLDPVNHVFKAPSSSSSSTDGNISILRKFISILYRKVEDERKSFRYHQIRTGKEIGNLKLEINKKIGAICEINLILRNKITTLEQLSRSHEH